MQNFIIRWTYKFQAIDLEETSKLCLNTARSLSIYMHHIITIEVKFICIM